jgi:hypothetical protein
MFEKLTPTRGDAGRKMLLHDESGGPRREGVFVTAQESRGARLGNRVCNIIPKQEHWRGVKGWEVAANTPDAENESFAIHDRDHALRGNGQRACDRLSDHLLHIFKSHRRRDLAEHWKSQKKHRNGNHSSFHLGNCPVSLLSDKLNFAMRNR